MVRLVFSDERLVASACHGASILSAMTADLRESRAKIERAQEHRELLEEVIASVYERKANRVQLNAKLDPQTGCHEFRVASLPQDWPLRVGLILGDFVHNTRGALEYLFYALSCHHLGVAKTERMGSQVQFPIEDDPQTLINKRVHFSKIPLAQWTIIEDAQPYYTWKSPNRALTALRDLSNRDKHRALNPVQLHNSSLTLSPEVREARPYTFGPLKWFSGREPFKVGTKVFEVAFPPEVDPEVEMAGYTTTRIKLPEGDSKIIEGVDLMIATVRGIVDGIEAEL
jgi:hypothetical protein